MRDLLVDLRDGEILILVAAQYLGVSAPRYNHPRGEGGGKATEALSLDRLMMGVSLLEQGIEALPPGVKARSLYEGNKEVTMGLVWWLILGWERARGRKIASQDAWVNDFETGPVKVDIVSSYTGHEFRFLARISAQETAAPSRQSVDMLICVDISGSMQRFPLPTIEVVKEAVFSELLSRLRPDDRLSVILFNDTPRVVLPLRPATPEYISWIIHELRSVHCEVVYYYLYYFLFINFIILLRVERTQLQPLTRYFMKRKVVVLIYLFVLCFSLMVWTRSIKLASWYGQQDCKWKALNESY